MLRIGILGGGQLGRMLLQQAANYPVETFVLEKGSTSPASSLCHHYFDGDIREFESVYNFGKQVDVLTIEIENVNQQALEKLEAEGLSIFPSPKALAVIRDKGLQKEFYAAHNIPTSAFVLVNNRSEIKDASIGFPIAQKLRTGGYDGKGVEILKSSTDIEKGFDEPCVLEKLVEIEKEISVIVAKNQSGEVAVYPAVEMVFNPKYNLVDFLLSPAEITEAQNAEAQKTALQVLHALDSCGIFAVEMFLDKTGNILVNETAPRAHNSGHQSIEGNYSSQYDMQMRVLQNLPLGNTAVIQPSLMLNLIGEAGYTGAAKYRGLEEAMRIPNVYIHLYGKAETKPGRKMGHVTILGTSKTELLEKAEQVRTCLKVVA